MVDQYCGGTFIQTLIMPPGQPSGAAINPLTLAQQALSSAPFTQLSVQMSPPSGREAVNFWIFRSVSSGFAPVTASATAGGVTSTVSITAQSVTWDMGDGTASFTCQGPGVPYDPTRSFDSQVPPPCGYRYSRSSADQPGGTFTVTATVHYHATWTVAGAPGGGDLGPVDRSVSIPVVVGEIQVVNQ
jgi:hypothetical protein